MHITELFRQAVEKGSPCFSVEFLPPLKGEGTQRIFEGLDPLIEFPLVSVNVTYHREDVKYVERENGLLERHTVRRRPGTVGISAAINHRYGIEVVPHLICGGQSRYDIEDALIDLDFLGIHNVLALRGDNLRGEHSFRVHPSGHGHASELVAQVAQMNQGVFVDGEVEQCHNTDFCIGVAGYPEKHAESPNMEEDLRRLKEKIDAGAHYIVTQMSFDNQRILKFIERCRAIGIQVPIIPGLKPFATQSQLTMLPQIFHVDLPQALVQEVEQCRTNAQVRELGVEWAIAQGRELMAAGVPMLHFYTMGKTDNMVKIAKALF
ncbi:MAG: methylenetetrahydrofolate reductase [Alistipes sp.]|nr:methylenetetrahydrofolate reductase [Alistipes sp.]